MHDKLENNVNDFANDLIKQNDNNFTGGAMATSKTQVKKTSKKKSPVKKISRKSNKYVQKQSKKTSRINKSPLKHSNSTSSLSSSSNYSPTKFKRSLPEALRKYQELSKFIVEKLNVKRNLTIMKAFIDMYRDQARKLTDDKIKQLEETKKLFLIDYNKGTAKEKYDKFAAEKGTRKDSKK